MIQWGNGNPSNFDVDAHRKRAKEIMDEVLNCEKLSTKVCESSAEAEQVFNPLRQYLNANNMVYKYHFKLLTFILCALIIYWSFETICWQLTVLTRLFLTSILPFWDWTVFSQAQCFLENPNYVKRQTQTDFNCLVCETVQNISVLPKTIDFEKRFLSVSEPVILTGFDFEQNIYDRLVSDTDYLAGIPCDVQTNLSVDIYRTPIAWFLKNAELFNNWMLYFRNCAAEDIKFARSVFSNIDILRTNNVLRTHSNWILLNKDFAPLKSIPIDPKNLVIVSQILGQSFIKLTPKPTCDNCNSLPAVLSHGQSLIFSSNLWDMEIGGNSKNLGMAFAEEINWGE